MPIERSDRPDDPAGEQFVGASPTFATRIVARATRSRVRLSGAVVRHLWLSAGLTACESEPGGVPRSGRLARQLGPSLRLFRIARNPTSSPFCWSQRRSFTALKLEKSVSSGTF
jgi:hypothetical protein